MSQQITVEDECDLKTNDTQHIIKITDSALDNMDDMKFDELQTKIENIMEQFVTKYELVAIFCCILKKASTKPLYTEQFAKLFCNIAQKPDRVIACISCKNILYNLKKKLLIDDESHETHKNTFLCAITIIAHIVNQRTKIFNQSYYAHSYIMKQLLPPSSPIELEGVCTFLTICGKTLMEWTMRRKGKKQMSDYIECIKQHSNAYVESQDLVHNLCLLRAYNWSSTAMEQVKQLQNMYADKKNIDCEEKINADCKRFIESFQIINLSQKSSTMTTSQFPLSYNAMEGDNKSYITANAEQLLIIINFKLLSSFKEIVLFSLPLTDALLSPPKAVYFYHIANVEQGVYFAKLLPQKLAFCNPEHLNQGRPVKFHNSHIRAKQLIIYIASNHSDSTQKTYLNGIHFVGLTDFDPSLVIDSPYGQLSLQQLKNINIPNKNNCLVAGLPLKLDCDTFKSNQWFGKYGNIKQIRFASHTHIYQSVRIQFEEAESAMNLIRDCNENNIKLKDRTLKARLSLNHYCPNFLSPTAECTETNCNFLHSWRHPNDIVSSSFIEQFNAKACIFENNIINSPHGQLSVKALSKMELREQNICFVEGLPLAITHKHELSLDRWFGQFGKIVNVSLSRKSDPMLQSRSAEITFEQSSSALNAIDHCNNSNFVFADARKVKARFGYTRYCGTFLTDSAKFGSDESAQCPAKHCTFIHSWRTTDDVVSNGDINRFKRIQYGALEPEYGIREYLKFRFANGAGGYKKITNIKIRNHNVCAVQGIPLDIKDKQELGLNRWFGQFGEILTISLSGSKADTVLQSKSAEITFEKVESARRVITYCKQHNFGFVNGRKFKARFGHRRYCSAFLDKRDCKNKGCVSMHSWCDATDYVTDKDIKTFNSIPYGIVTNNVTDNDKPESSVCGNIDIKYIPAEDDKAAKLKPQQSAIYDLFSINAEECKLKFEKWLDETVGLPQYLPVFRENEYDDIKMIKYFDDDNSTRDVMKNELGIHNELHCKLLIEKINEFHKMMKHFNQKLQIHQPLIQYASKLEEKGILTLYHLKQDIKTSVDVKNVLGIDDNHQIQTILSIILNV